MTRPSRYKYTQFIELEATVTWQPQLERRLPSHFFATRLRVSVRESLPNQAKV